MARVAPSERFRRELDEVLAGVDGEPPALAAGARFARVLAGAEQDQASELARSAPPTMPRVAASCRLRSRTNALTVRVHAQSEPDVTELVPSDAFPHGLAALERLVHEADSVSAAVAFVTDSGVSALRELLDGRADIELVVRAGGITSPAAVLALRNDLGINVSVVISRDAAAFHPKLWLFRSAESLAVLSGSGNLTHGGLVDNNEQFEIIRVELNSDEAAAHEERLDRLTANAIPLDDVEGSTLWLEWESVIKRQRRYREVIRRLEASLADRPFVGRRDDDKRRLIEDLQELYDLTVDAKLPRRDGQPYIPDRFREGIERARAGADPVLLVTRICRRQTEGFDVILNANRPYLTVESLVVDTTKPYHDLFTGRTRELSAQRLQQFPSWNAGPGG